MLAAEKTKSTVNKNITYVLSKSWRQPVVLTLLLTVTAKIWTSTLFDINVEFLLSIYVVLAIMTITWKETHG